MLRHGRRCPDGRAWSKRYFAWLAIQRWSLAALEQTFASYRRAIDDIVTRLRAVDTDLQAALTVEPLAPRVARLRCFRGIDDLTALTIAVELGDASRFSAARHVMGFSGLVPSEYSSGATQKRGGITKTGNAHLRRVLVEAAWHYRHRPAIGLRLRARQAPRRPQRFASLERAASAARPLSTPARARQVTTARDHGGRARIVSLRVGGVDVVIGSAELYGRILERSMR